MPAADTGLGAGKGSRRRIMTIPAGLVLLVVSPFLIPGLEYDFLNVIPLAVALTVAVGCAKAGGASKSKRGWWHSPWWRAAMAMLFIALAFEFGVRAFSFHRTILYERSGDLLYTPVPDQRGLEKISLTRTRINNLGLRGSDVAATDLRKRTILCLGDSITYGYGVADAHTYPALLQTELDQRAPARFLVLNAGVNAYPITMMREKLEHLWNLGVRPETVIIAYSLNEGWLGALTRSDAATKDTFARRVWLKNFVRRSGLYNVLVENLARSHYDRLKARLIPGTHRTAADPVDRESIYEEDLRMIAGSVRRRGASLVFLNMCSYNSKRQAYGTASTMQQRFADFAHRSDIPYLSSEDAIRPVAGSEAEMQRFFVDVSHMNLLGTRLVAQYIANHLVGDDH